MKIKLMNPNNLNNHTQPIIKEKKTPATTIVEECNRLLTGVGPSIAMGNQ